MAREPTPTPVRMSNVVYWPTTTTTEHNAPSPLTTLPHYLDDNAAHLLARPQMNRAERRAAESQRRRAERRRRP